MLVQHKWLSVRVIRVIYGVIVVATMFSLGGCTSPIWTLSKPQLDQANEVVRRDLYQQEVAYYPHPHAHGGRPKVCLALSGGGLRSAAYSIGVMRALHETGILDRVDVISAVSGGSYALSWYFSQSMLGQGGKKSTVFDHSDYVDAIAANTEWLPLKESIWRGIVGFSPLSRVTIAEIKARTGWFSMWTRLLKPLSYLWTILSRGHRSIDSKIYAEKIAATFFPQTKKRNKDGSDGEETVQELPLKGLAQEIMNRGLPYFVINATAQFDTNNEGHLSLSQRVVEFTPLHVGGDGVGWKSISEQDLNGEYFPKDLATVASISGAVADSAEEFKFSGWNRAGIWFAEANLGYLMAGLRAENEYVLLTDGGHAENLGVFPLVRRRCEEIYVVDAEWEPTFRAEDNWSFTFEGYQILKHALECEHGAKMTVADIENALQSFKSTRPGCRGKSGNGMRTVDLSWETLPRIQLKKPVMQEAWIDFNATSGREGSADDFRSHVTYIKLAADRRLLGTKGPRAEQCYGKNVVDWFGMSNEKEWQLQGSFPYFAYGEKDPTFPHVSTFHLDWKKEQFNAYTELGYRNVINFHTKKEECM